MLRRKKVLIVLNDIDNSKQIESHEKACFVFRNKDYYYDKEFKCVAIEGI